MGNIFIYTPKSSNVMMEKFLCDSENCLSFNFEKSTTKEEVAKIHSSVEDSYDYWLQDDKNDEKPSQVFEIVQIPSCVALISDNSSESDFFCQSRS